MLNYILPILIFLSLGIIIFIVGKHLPEFKKSKKDNDFDKKNKAVKEKFTAFVLNIVKKIKEFFLFLAEKTVKKSKKILHLVHFWLIKIKNKKNKKDDFYDDIKAKEQLIKEEEDDLDHVINEDLATADEQDLIKQEQEKKKTEGYNSEEIKKDPSNQKRKDSVNDYYLKKEEKQEFSEEADPREKKQPSQEVNENFKKELLEEISEFQKEEDKEEKEKTQKKVSQFFSQGNAEENSLGQENEAVARDKEILTEEPEETEEERKAKEIEEQEAKEEKEGRIKTFLGKANPFNRFRKAKEKKASEEERESEEDVKEESNDKFSDGIVKIEDYQKPKKEENLLIKEVVKVNRSAAETDDEIGVDREILEKKLVQKIVENPKQIENYRQLGELYIKIENYPEALECYKQILRIYPRDVDSKRKMEKVAFLKRVKKREENK